MNSNTTRYNSDKYYSSNNNSLFNNNLLDANNTPAPTQTPIQSQMQMNNTPAPVNNNVIKVQSDINNLPTMMNNNSSNNKVTSNSASKNNKQQTEPTIDTLLDSVMEMPVSNEQKLKMLNILRDNIQKPDMDEERRFKEIEDKYLNMFAKPQPQPQQQYGMMPQQQYGMMPQQLPYGMMPQQQYGMMPQQLPYGMMPQQLPYGMMPQQLPYGMDGYMINNRNGGTLNEYHFQILKDGLDVIRTEIIDLMRHLKDYTQRYMANTRESDIEKITDYINEMMNINKNLEQAKVVAENIKAEDEIEEEKKTDEENKGIIDKAGALFSGAVNGVKSAVGSVGDIITNTVKAANNVLGKPVISGEDQQTGQLPSTEQPPQQNVNTSAKVNKNMVDVDDYLKNNSRTDFEPSYRPNEYLTNQNINVNADQSPHFSKKSISSVSEQLPTTNNTLPTTNNALPTTNNALPTQSLTDSINKVNSAINRENKFGSQITNPETNKNRNKTKILANNRRNNLANKTQILNKTANTTNIMVGGSRIKNKLNKTNKKVLTRLTKNRTLKY